jgi:hypothetical protein
MVNKMIELVFCMPAPQFGDSVTVTLKLHVVEINLELENLRPQIFLSKGNYVTLKCCLQRFVIHLKTARSYYAV